MSENTSCPASRRRPFRKPSSITKAHATTSPPQRRTSSSVAEAVPAHVDVDRLRRALENVPGTTEVHDLHVWSLTTGRYALSAHAVVTDGTHAAAADDAILATMAELCARDFHIEHVTIQIEHESRRAAEPVH